MLTRPDHPEPLSETPGISLDALTRQSSEQLLQYLAVARRQKVAIIVSISVCFFLALTFIMQAVPQYTATTSLLIDSKQVGVSATTPYEGALAFETGAVDSQVLLVQSDRIASLVVDHLDLLHNEEFLHPQHSALEAMTDAVAATASAALRQLGLMAEERAFGSYPADIQRSLLVLRLERSLKVTRNARTYVLTIDYSDPDPRLARSIASAYASAYLEDQLESRFDTARRAATWLDARISEIKTKALSAGQTAQSFREKNSLTESSGRLINEQALTDANGQLSIARNDLAAATAKYDRLKQIVDNKDYSASNVDALASPIISQLRGKLLDADKLNVEVSSRLGAQHDAAVRARKDVEQYNQLIFGELLRLQQSYHSEVEISANRVAAAERSVAEMSKTRDTNAAALAKLKTLDQEALTYETLYANYLQKAQELLQQQSLPINDARLITDAAMPLLPSSPKKLLILLASIVLGVVLGGGIAALREFRERGFRTSAEVRSAIGLNFVAYVPTLPKAAFLVSSASSPKQEDRRNEAQIRPSHPGLSVVIDEPLSRYAESMRAMKLSTDFHFGLHKPLVIGIVSSFPDEGKSTVAKNFASLLALQGEQVLLIDADMRNPRLTRNLTPSARMGLLELLHGGAADLEKCLHLETQSGLHFLPASSRGRVPATGDALASVAMKELVQTLRSRYDMIVVDLPPLGAVLDAVAAASYIDGYHMLVEWRRTPRSAVADILATAPIVATRIVGVSLTKVNVGKLQSYNAHSAYGYTGTHLLRYYQS